MDENEFSAFHLQNSISKICKIFDKDQEFWQNFFDNDMRL